MSIIAAVAIICGLALGFYGNNSFHYFLSGLNLGVGIFFAIVAFVNYRAVCRKERWWKGK